MLNEILKEVIVHVAGKPAESIAVLLNPKQYVNEFVIAKKIGLTINQTRNLLYKISAHGLISSIRKKDKKKGWYTYFWKIEILKCLEFLKQLLLKQIEQLNSQIKGRKIKQFYVCERCNIELNEETALLHNFTCNECGEVFALKDNSKLLRELQRNLEKFERKLAALNKEIEIEQKKIGALKAREAKKAEKEKAALRKREALKRKRLFKKKSPIKKKFLKKKKPKKIKKKSAKKKPHAHSKKKKKGR